MSLFDFGIVEKPFEAIVHNYSVWFFCLAVNLKCYLVSFKSGVLCLFPHWNNKSLSSLSFTYILESRLSFKFITISVVAFESYLFGELWFPWYRSEQILRGYYVLGIKNNSFMLFFIINNFFSYLPVYVGQALQKVKIHSFFLPITFCLNTKF